MSHLSKDTITRVGVDLAKRVIQVHAVDGSGWVVFTKALQRDAFLPWRGQVPPGTLIAVEACSGAHHWARRLISMWLDARTEAAHFVSAYRMLGRSGKNDANDAAAICEAASRPTNAIRADEDSHAAGDGRGAQASQGIQGGAHRLHQSDPRPTGGVWTRLQPAGRSPAPRVA